MRSSFKAWAIGVVMVATGFAAWLLQPRILMSEHRDKLVLEQLIPSEFRQWKTLPQSTGQIINPQQAAILDGIYSASLSRTYINSDGDVVMLSIAYGANQSRDLQIHRPEVCYSAQGFQVSPPQKTILKTSTNAVPAMHLVARLGQRNEPITYWVRIGGKVVRGNLEQGFARLGYGLSGVVADGVLFRVSSIAAEPAKAYASQLKFIDDLLGSVPENTKSYLLGNAQ